MGYLGIHNYLHIMKFRIYDVSIQLGEVGARVREEQDKQHQTLRIFISYAMWYFSLLALQKKKKLFTITYAN